MEERLEQYRSTVRRREFFSSIKRRLVNMVQFNPVTKKDETIVITEPDMETTPDSVDPTRETDSPDCSTSGESDVEPQPAAIENKAECEASKFQYVSYLVWFCFWLTCWFIAIELQFGTVYLMLSALFGIYFNTRTTPKAKHEVSAYSVFNENCESINGTLKAEQFEAEIRYGPMTVKQ